MQINKNLLYTLLSRRYRLAAARSNPRLDCNIDKEETTEEVRVLMQSGDKSPPPPSVGRSLENLIDF